MRNRKWELCIRDTSNPEYFSGVNALFGIVEQAPRFQGRGIGTIGCSVNGPWIRDDFPYESGTFRIRNNSLQCKRGLYYVFNNVWFDTFCFGHEHTNATPHPSLPRLSIHPSVHSFTHTIFYSTVRPIRSFISSFIHPIINWFFLFGPSLCLYYY